MKKEKKDIRESLNLSKKNFNIQTLIAFLCGFLVSLTLLKSSKLASLSKDNIISVISIVIDLAVVFFLALFYEKRFSDNRSVKNYLVQELNSIHDEYKTFLNKLSREEYEGIYVNNWFKIINIRIGHLNYFLKENLNIEDDRLKRQHLELRELITNSESFNNTFKGNIKLDTQVKNKVIENNKFLSHSIINLTIKIHKK